MKKKLSLENLLQHVFVGNSHTLGRAIVDKTPDLNGTWSLPKFYFRDVSVQPEGGKEFEPMPYMHYREGNALWFAAINTNLRILRQLIRAGVKLDTKAVPYNYSKNKIYKGDIGVGVKRTVLESLADTDFFLLPKTPEYTNVILDLLKAGADLGSVFGDTDRRSPRERLFNPYYLNEGIKGFFRNAPLIGLLFRGDVEDVTNFMTRARIDTSAHSPSVVLTSYLESMPDFTAKEVETFKETCSRLKDVLGGALATLLPMILNKHLENHKEHYHETIQELSKKGYTLNRELNVERGLDAGLEELGRQNVELKDLLLSSRIEIDVQAAQIESLENQLSARLTEVDEQAARIKSLEMKLLAASKTATKPDADVLPDSAHPTSAKRKPSSLRRGQKNPLPNIEITRPESSEDSIPKKANNKDIPRHCYLDVKFSSGLLEFSQEIERFVTSLMQTPEPITDTGRQPKRIRTFFYGATRNFGNKGSIDLSKDTTRSATAVSLTFHELAYEPSTHRELSKANAKHSGLLSGDNRWNFMRETDAKRSTLTIVMHKTARRVSLHAQNINHEILDTLIAEIPSLSELSQLLILFKSLINGAEKTETINFSVDSKACFRFLESDIRLFKPLGVYEILNNIRTSFDEKLTDDVKLRNDESDELCKILTQIDNAGIASGKPRKVKDDVLLSGGVFGMFSEIRTTINNLILLSTEEKDLLNNAICVLQNYITCDSTYNIERPDVTSTKHPARVGEQTAQLGKQLAASKTATKPDADVLPDSAHPTSSSSSVSTGLEDRGTPKKNTKDTLVREPKTTRKPKTLSSTDERFSGDTAKENVEIYYSDNPASDRSGLDVISFKDIKHCSANEVPLATIANIESGKQDYIKYYPQHNTAFAEYRGGRDEQEDRGTFFTLPSDQFPEDKIKAMEVLFDRLEQKIATMAKVKNDTSGSTASVTIAQPLLKSNQYEFTHAFIGDTDFYLAIKDCDGKLINLAKSSFLPSEITIYSEGVARQVKPKFIAKGKIMRVNAEHHNMYNDLERKRAEAIYESDDNKLPYCPIWGKHLGNPDIALLAVSRSFNDPEFRKYGLTHKPEIASFKVTVPEGYEIVALHSCDGLVESIETTDISETSLWIGYFIKAIERLVPEKKLAELAHKLGQIAIKKGSRDNISAMVATLASPKELPDDDKDAKVFAVFDGHGGDQTAEYLLKHFHQECQEAFHKEMMLIGKEVKIAGGGFSSSSKLFGRRPVEDQKEGNAIPTINSLVDLCQNYHDSKDGDDIVLSQYLLEAVKSLQKAYEENESKNIDLFLTEKLPSIFDAIKRVHCKGKDTDVINKMREKTAKLLAEQSEPLVSVGRSGVGCKFFEVRPVGTIETLVDLCQNYHDSKDGDKLSIELLREVKALQKAYEDEKNESIYNIPTIEWYSLFGTIDDSINNFLTSTLPDLFGTIVLINNDDTDVINKMRDEVDKLVEEQPITSYDMPIVMVG